MPTLPLFDQPDRFPRDRLAEELRRLAAEGIYIGTSSWKYEGWLGQIYSRERYLARGRFSQKQFEARCLAEYAEVFPVVGGDFSFYQFPSPAYWQRLFGSAPGPLRFGLKAPEEITVRSWPKHARYGPRAGSANPGFLDARLFEQGFLEPLQPYRERVAAILFEFGAFPAYAYRDPGEFLPDLEAFLAALPPGFSYGVEVRNPEFLTPDYFACLRAFGVAHVLNAWTRMPELGEQLALPGVFTAGFTVCRALLARGMAYEEAVARYAPYASIQRPDPRGRAALEQLIGRARADGRSAFVFVNNRFEGNAPGTILAITGLDDDSD